MPGGESPLTIRDVTSLYSILLLGTARYRSLVPDQVFYFFGESPLTIRDELAI